MGRWEMASPASSIHQHQTEKPPPIWRHFAPPLTNMELQEIASLSLLALHCICPTWWLSGPCSLFIPGLNGRASRQNGYPRSESCAEDGNAPTHHETLLGSQQGLLFAPKMLTGISSGHSLHSPDFFGTVWCIINVRDPTASRRDRAGLVSANDE